MRHPLNALKAFEASARHLSHVKAAEELFVTPAAISHQVKRLEAYLGVNLFRRLPNGLLLTQPAQRLMSDLGDVFAQLDAAVARARAEEARGALTLSVAPMFTVKWLLPRLGSFETRHPEIDVRISSSLEIVDLQRDGFDGAIRLGKGTYSGLRSVKLFDETLTPMCSPALARRLKRPADLAKLVLLHDDSMSFDRRSPTWHSWLRAVGEPSIDTNRGPRFSQPDHGLQAAIDGAGVVLGWRYLAQRDLDAGRLKQPFAQQLPLGSAFHFVYPDADVVPGRISAFLTWLANEIEADRALRPTSRAPAQR